MTLGLSFLLLLISCCRMLFATTIWLVLELVLFVFVASVVVALEVVLLKKKEKTHQILVLIST